MDASDADRRATSSLTSATVPAFCCNAVSKWTTRSADELSSGEHDQIRHLVEPCSDRSQTIGQGDHLAGDQRVERVSGVVDERIPLGLCQLVEGEEALVEGAEKDLAVDAVVGIQCVIVDRADERTVTPVVLTCPAPAGIAAVVEPVVVAVVAEGGSHLGLVTEDVFDSLGRGVAECGRGIW